MDFGEIAKVVLMVVVVQKYPYKNANTKKENLVSYQLVVMLVIEFRMLL